MDGCGGRKGGMDCEGFGGLRHELRHWGKKTSQLRKYKRNKSKSGICDLQRKQHEK